MYGKHDEQPFIHYGIQWDNKTCLNPDDQHALHQYKVCETMRMRYNLKLLVQCLSESDMELSMYSVTKIYFSSTELMETTQIKYTLNSVRTI